MQQKEVGGLLPFTKFFTTISTRLLPFTKQEIVFGIIMRAKTHIQYLR